MQRALILRGPKQRYELVEDWALPPLRNSNEVLIRIEAIGLNPIDWKSVDYGFGIPTLPAVNGRDLAGIILDVGAEVKRLKKGDKVFGPSTQYRDYRTSAFQSYAVTQEHCLGVIPSSLSFEKASAIGVGVVTAALALGSSLGIKIHDFAPRDLAAGTEGEPEEWVQAVKERQAANLKTETKNSSLFNRVISTLSSLNLGSPKPDVPSRDHDGEWLLIWGGSAVTGFFAAQFAIMADMRVIAVADKARHGKRLEDIGVEHIVDRSSPKAAVEEIRNITGGELHYAIDCVGKQTACYAVEALSTSRQSYIVGLTGLPEDVPENVQPCTVPIKTFHSNPSVGESLMRAIEDLLIQEKLILPDVEVHHGGLGAVNDALDRLRKGEISGGRLVILTASGPENIASESVVPLTT